jgi:tetratricopeptide (TPR) repeat protein
MRILLATSAPYFWGPQVECLAAAMRGHGHDASVATYQTLDQAGAFAGDVLFCLGSGESLLPFLDGLRAPVRILYLIESLPTLSESDEFTRMKLAVHRPYLADFDHVFVHSQRSMPMLQFLGVTRVEALLWPHFPSIFYPVPSVEKDIDVLFVGTPSGHRQRLLERAATRFQVNVASNIFHASSSVLYGRAKVALNLHFTPLRNLECRVVEALGCGAFLLTEALDPDDVLRDGEHLVAFNEDNLLDLLDRYLHDPDERERIADAGHAEVQKYHVNNQAGRILQVAGELSVKDSVCYRLDRPQATHHASPIPEARPKRGRPPVSLCMIVKNEEQNLADCLGSVADLVDETIVIDTGSTDRTVEVAQQLGAKVYSFAWVDSFAAARNESLRHATGDWVFWLDADDRLDAENRQRLGTLFANLPSENVAFVMKCLCLPDAVSRRSTAVDHIRLFRRHPELRWRYRVHEQILGSIRALGGTVRWSDVVIHHTGYQDPALRQRKLHRDQRLLMMEHAENPDDPFVMFNLGMILHEMQRPGEALGYLSESLRKSHPSDSIVRKLYALISQCQRQVGRLEEALATCREGRMHYPFDLELLFHESVVLKEMGDANGSEACLLHVLFAQEKEHFASVNPALRAIARHNLAVLCREQGRDGEAESHWLAVAAEDQDRSRSERATFERATLEHLPCWVGLGELCLSQQRWAELDDVLAWLDADSGAAIDSGVLRARALMSRGELAEARALLEGMIKREPAALLPRVVLTHVLLKENRDMQAAEQALHDVLALCPEHAEARHNLAVLTMRLDTVQR